MNRLCAEHAQTTEKTIEEEVRPSLGWEFEKNARHSYIGVWAQAKGGKTLW